MTETVYAWAPITKAEPQDDGTVMVYGPVADAGLDRDRQRLDQGWLDQAVPTWMAEGANVREQHDRFKAAGVGVGLTKGGDGTHLLAACIVDPVTAKKCLPGPNGRPPVLKGFSVGIKDPQISFTKADAPGGYVVGGKIVEVSVVDRPSNPRTLFTVAKADAVGGLELAGDAELLERTDLAGDPNAEDDVLYKFVSAAQRREDAKSGVAMDNGDFPIPDEGHLRSAIGHLGDYNGDRAAARRHIIARARALGLTHLLPDDWNVSKADQVLADLAQLVPAEQLAKADQATDIATAHEAIGAIGRLIQSEAQGLADGRLTESCDIDVLIQAVDALKRFIAMEQREQPDEPAGGGTGELDPGQEADDYNVNGDVILMADEPDATKTEGTARPLTKTEFADMLKSAVAEATEPLKGEVELVKAELAKVSAAPAPGGPVQTRTAAQAAGARAHDALELRTQANQLLAKADQIGNNDPALASGYRERAEQLLAKADA